MNDTRLSILVVDDDHDTADTLATLLLLTGYRARAANDAIQALEMIAEEWPDVVILDLLMPGMDGWELAHRLSFGPCDQQPFLIAVTGCDGKDERRRAREEGIDLYLLKPVHLDALVEVLERFWQFIGPVVVH